MFNPLTAKGIRICAQVKIQVLVELGSSILDELSDKFWCKLRIFYLTSTIFFYNVNILIDTCYFKTMKTGLALRGLTTYNTSHFQISCISAVVNASTFWCVALYMEA